MIIEMTITLEKSHFQTFLLIIVTASAVILIYISDLILKSHKSYDILLCGNPFAVYWLFIGLFLEFSLLASLLASCLFNPISLLFILIPLILKLLTL